MKPLDPFLLEDPAETRLPSGVGFAVALVPSLTFWAGLAFFLL